MVAEGQTSCAGYWRPRLPQAGCHSPSANARCRTAADAASDTLLTIVLGRIAWSLQCLGGLPQARIRQALRAAGDGGLGEPEMLVNGVRTSYCDSAARIASARSSRMTRSLRRRFDNGRFVPAVASKSTQLLAIVRYAYSDGAASAAATARTPPIRVAPTAQAARSPSSRQLAPASNSGQDRHAVCAAILGPGSMRNGTS